MSIAPPPRGSIANSAYWVAQTRRINLAAGDAFVFLLFAFLGRLSHHETGAFDIGDAMWQTILVAVPFALGWFAVAPFVGAFRRSRTDTPARMVRTTLLAWLAAWPATLLLRWAFTGRVPPVSFAMVILLANAVLLGLQRSAFVFWERMRASWGDARLHTHITNP
ncbi:MAG TPA: DUF3054 domain-containing protein [Ktedonobacterales bacterium]|nr:DUF3054 domain-containing protein [Ktedonobacterales bacterium]